MTCDPEVTPRHFHTEVFLIAGDEYCITTSRLSRGETIFLVIQIQYFVRDIQIKQMKCLQGCCCRWASLKLHITQDNKLSTLLFALPKLSTLLSGCLLLEEKGSTSPQRTVIMWCMLKLKPKYQGLVQRLVMSAQLSWSSCCVQVFEAGVTCSHKAAPQYKCRTGHIFRVCWDTNTSTKNKVTFLLVLNQCLSTHFLWVLHNREWNWRISNQTRLPRVADAHYDKLPHYF